MGDAEYKIVKKIKILSQGTVKTKELNIVKWRDFDPMYDIRKWENGQPGRGIALSVDEAKELYKALGEELLGN